MSNKHFPKTGDKVNDTRRTHANGHVVKVIYNDGPDEVMVRFEDGIEYYDYHEFEYSWTDNYGGCFILSRINFGNRRVENV